MRNTSSSIFHSRRRSCCRYARLGARVSVRLKTGFEVYVRVLGMTADEARILLNKFTLDGRVPEPVRVARLAARAALHLEEAV